MIRVFKILCVWALTNIATKNIYCCAEDEWRSIDEPEIEQLSSIQVTDITGYDLPPRCNSAPIDPPKEMHAKVASSHAQFGATILCVPKPRKPTNSNSLGKRKSRRLSPINVPRSADSSPVCFDCPKPRPKVIALKNHVHPKSDEDWNDYEDYTEIILEMLLKNAFDKEDEEKKKKEAK